MSKYFETKKDSLEQAVLEAMSPAQQAAIAISKKEKLPDSLTFVNKKEEKFEVISENLEKVKNYILKSI